MKDKNNVLIFGIGIAGRAIYRQIKSSHNIVGFIENNSTLVGTMYHHLPIISLKQLDKIDFDLIALSGVWIDSMLAQLKEYNVDKSKIWTIADNALNFSSTTRVDETDKLIGIIAKIAQENSIQYCVGGSSLLCLMRDTDLSNVADVDLFVKSQDTLRDLYNLLSKSSDLHSYEIIKRSYNEDKILSKKNQIDKIVVKSLNSDASSEPTIIDINWVFSYKDDYIIDHGNDYLIFPKSCIDGERYHTYKNIELLIPYDAETFLSSLYGKNYIVPAKKWSQNDYRNLLKSDVLEKMVNG